MSNKYKIILSLSFALAVFYSLPWIALFERTRGSEGLLIQNGTAGERVTYLFLSVFSVSVLFFQYNFFWKHTLRFIGNRIIHRLLIVIFNIAILSFASVIIMIISIKVFSVGTGQGYFIFYVFRNMGIMFIVMLVTYVVELVDKSKKDHIEILTLQNKNTETELAALRAQIDPHFLFNSLTALSGLIRSDSKEAIAFVDHLAETFRYTMDKREHTVVTVKDELHFLESYIFMMKRRFNDGLQVRVNISEEHLEKKIPQFAMQAAVENALKHNVISVRSPLVLEIFSTENAVVIRNNRQMKKFISGYGIGLANLSKRYQLIDNNRMTINKSDHFFEINLPLL